MTARALGTALIFGAIGGAALGLWSGWRLSTTGEGGAGVFVAVSVYIAGIGALVGVVIASAALIVGTIAGDIAGTRGARLARPVGATTTMLTTTAAFATLLLIMGATRPDPTTVQLVLGCTLYGGAVAWLRLPWIYAGGRVQSDDLAMRTRM